MFTSVAVVGRGRVGGAIAARLHEQGLLSDASADLVLLCVPDTAIAETAQALPVGPWIAHVSGATPLAALAPHTHRFTLHPLQTFTKARGPEQLDDAWAAVTAEHDEGLAAARWLADRLGLRPFDLADDRRVLYHAGAVMAGNYLVTLHRAASRAFTAAGAPPQALLPLIQRTIDNGFALTGPLARGDRTTVEAHVTALSEELPDLVAVYLALAEATVR